MSTFILVHVIISLIGIVSGLIVLFGLLANRPMAGLTAVFLTTTVATSVTGFFFFPFDGFTPAQAFGILSMALLSLAVCGRYIRDLEGRWRKIYVITAIASLYLNVFVAIVQGFQKIPVLKAAAPTQASPLFAVAQLSALILFVIAGFAATKRFQPEVPA